MCIQHISIDRYADGREIIQKREWEVCRHGSPYRPRDCEHFYEEGNEYHIYDVLTSMSSRSSDTSSLRGAPSLRAPSTIDSRDRSPRPSYHHSKKNEKEFTPLVFNAIFGGRTTKTKRRPSSHSKTTVVIEDRLPRVYPTSPAPPSPFRPSFSSSDRYSPSPMSPATPRTPGFESTWEGAVIVDASPESRGRRGTPVIVDNGRRQRRSDSIEVHPGRSTAPLRPRSPSPDYYDRRREEQRAADEERRRRRDLREATLTHEIAEGRARQRREQERQLHDEEIRARPVRPVVEQNSPPVRPGILKNQSVRRARRESIIEDLNMTERGEQVLRAAIAEREAREAEERINRERRRLARRFEREPIIYPGESYRR